MQAVKSLAHRAWSKRHELTFVSLGGYLTLGVTFITQVVLARTLGPENFGVYAASLAIISLVEVPLVVRSSELALRYLGAYWIKGGRNVDEAIGRIAKIDQYLFLASFLGLAVASKWLSDTAGADWTFFMLLTLVIPAQLGFGIYKSYFVISNSILQLTRLELTYSIVLLVASLAGFESYGMHGLAVATVIAALAKTGIARYHMRRYLSGNQMQGDSLVLPETQAKDSVYSMARTLLSNGFNQADVILIAAMQQPHIVAIYKVAKSLSSLPTKLAFPIWRYAQPKILEAAHTGDRQALRVVILSGSALLLFAAIFIAPAVLLYGQRVINFVYGAQYDYAYGPMLLLLVGVWAFNGISGWFKFWSVVNRSQFGALLVYAGMLGLLCAAGYLYGSRGATEMALTVSGVYLMSSILVTTYTLAR